MRKFLRNVLFIIATCCCHAAAGQAQPQTGFYVPKSAKIFFYGDTATIFSNVMNYGQFGLGRKAFVNFSGKVWENDPQSAITNEYSGGTGALGPGGWVRFLSDSFRQIIKGGYNTAIKSGPSFFNVQIQNRLGVELNESNAKIRNEILFNNGLFYLGDYMLSVGNNDPGIISYYDSTRYFVTGNKPGGGFLIRENIRRTDGQTVFPVGSKAGSYTPAAIKSEASQGDDYYVSVFDGVRSGISSGNSLADRSVNKTWEIGKRFQPGFNRAEIFLQHQNSDEGSLFTQNKAASYVSWFNGGQWDVGTPQSYPSPGYLTSGAPLDGSGVNSRIFNNPSVSSSYFAKFAGPGDSTLKTILWFNARRTGNATVRVYWKTNPEVMVQVFIVQRRLSNEAGFTDIDTVYSLINGGISLAELNYSLIDPNGYTGISFYRLRVVNVNTTFFYSNIVAVGGIPGRSLNLLWPNPAQDVFFVSCDPVWKVEYIVIWNAIGQKLKQEPTNGRNVIQLSGLITPGTYFVGFIREGGQIIETKKLIIIGK